MDIGFPFGVDERGLVAEAEYDEHIRQMIEQVLFTEPGERVNRPEFGCGLMQVIFAPMSDELAVTTEALVQNALQRWLSELINVESVQVIQAEERLLINVQYFVRENQQRHVASFTTEGLA